MKIKPYNTEYIAIAIFVVLKLFILLFADMHTGFDGDEVMHIESGNHLDWGYATFQPVLGLISWIQNLFHSNSIFVQHLFVHLAASLIIVFCGLTIIKLGGTWKAVTLSLTCVLVAPGYMITNNSFMPLVFDQLFWVICFYILVCFCLSQINKYIYFLAIFLGFGFLVKISILILIAGLSIAILLVQIKILSNKHFYLAFACFLIIIAPNLYWQYNNGFPSIGHMSALYKTVLNEVNVWSNIKTFLLSLNPLTIFIWFPGIFILPFLKQYKQFRLVTFSMLLSFLILFISRGQFYYFYPIMLFAFCTGSVLIEQSFLVKNKVFIGYYILLVLSGLVIIPGGTTLLPLDKYIKFNKLDRKAGVMKSSLFFTKQAMQDNKENLVDARIPIPYEAYYATRDWKNLIEAINRTYNQLAEKDKQYCQIWGRYYTQAGAINLLNKKYSLPKAFSFNGCYYSWAPNFTKDIFVLAVTNSQIKGININQERYFAPYFDSIELTESVFCPYARENFSAYYQVYLCKGLKINSDSLKQIFKTRIFE
jgi:hypothetical protein